MRVLICDNGTGFLKVGFSDAGESLTIPTVVGRPILKSQRSFNKLVDKKLAPMLFGQDALRESTNVELCYPIENGIIKDFDLMTSLWHFSFQSLIHTPSSDKRTENSQIAASVDINFDVYQEYKILLTEPALNTVKNRESVIDIFLRIFQFSGVYIGVQPVLALYSQGFMSGLVLDCGEGTSSIVPVYDGYALTHLAKRFIISGAHISKELSQQLFQRNGTFGMSYGNILADSTASASLFSNRQILDDVKRKYCFVAVDLNLEKKLAKETTFYVETYQVPEESRRFSLAEERFEAPEIIFQPQLAGFESEGLSSYLFQIIQEADMDIRPQLYRQILVSGGSTLFPGFRDRLQNEIESLYLKNIMKGNIEARANSKIVVEVIAPSDRELLVFQGAKFLGQILENQAHIWITPSMWASNPQAVLQQLGPR